MRKLIFVLVLIFLAGAAYAQQFPRPTNYLSDFAGVVEAGWVDSINFLGKQVEDNSSAQVFVATINDTYPYTAKEYATLLFNEWKIGKKGVDNGVLVLLAFSPERRVEVETGYGVEGMLPDSKVGRILDKHLQYFKDGNYGEGLYNVMKDLGDVIMGSGSSAGFDSESGDTPLVLIFIVIWALLFFTPIMINASKREKCPGCRKRMKLTQQKAEGEYMLLTYKCHGCGKEVKKKVKKTRKNTFIFVAGGFGGRGSGGSFGGGGGFSGGGGAGRGF
jgi:uncharacterized protein